MHLNKRQKCSDAKRDNRGKSPMVTPTVDSKDTVSARPERLRTSALISRLRQEVLMITCFWRSWNRYIPDLSQQGTDVEYWSNEMQNYTPTTKVSVSVPPTFAGSPCRLLLAEMSPALLQGCPPAKPAAAGEHPTGAVHHPPCRIGCSLLEFHKTSP